MESTTTSSTSSATEADYLNTLIAHATANNFSVAVWRLPDNKTKHLIISRKHELLKQDATLEELPMGFMFAPFNRAADRIFLKADLAFTFEDSSLKPGANPVETTSEAWLATHLKNTPYHKKARFHKLTYEPSSTPRQDFMDTVALGITEIEQGTFEKIVPSRTQVISLGKDFDIVTVFQNLCANIPNALVSFVSTPESGSWIGATPELLVSVENRNIFRTIALAGTQAHHEGVNLKNVAWTQKDIEEQALVERYIISCFKKIRLREFEEHGPKTVVAGNLLHLRSEFKVDMQATNFPQLGSVMLQLLHPTSAVCGMPLDTSMEFLNRREKYDRQFYAGYLGPVNFNNGTNIFVNLRCAQLLEDKAVLYAGAGVTIDSTPEQEWIETEMKMNTLLKIIINE
ncbi:MAG TPA: chorismate-binding protein [Chryseolinea sp.]|nr:chorismate-binding protein [Chryseolinea sp.]